MTAGTIGRDRRFCRPRRETPLTSLVPIGVAELAARLRARAATGGRDANVALCTHA
jgi:hypothetical protein